MSKPSLTVKDFTKAFMDGLKAIKKYETLVGVPQSTDSRPDGEISNASLLFIHEHGSPANNIPARPVLSIGIKRAQPEIVEEMRKAVVEGFKRGGSSVEKYYQRAGIIASQSVKNVINEQIDIEAPAQSTLDARKARGFKGTKALIVSGQMRNSITYVVRNK